MFQPKVMPARIYLLLFLVIALGIYVGFNIKLYQDAEDIRQQTRERITELAQIELASAINTALASVKSRDQGLESWNEIHQQLTDPSYYFFWHDERLKESPYWSIFYDQLELYNAQGKPLRALKNLKEEQTLPDQVPEKTLYFVNEGGHLDLVTFQTIYDKGDKNILGYVGLSMDFLPLLMQSYQFTYLDKSTLKVAKNSKAIQIDPKEIYQKILFSPVKNPVNDFLWDLIQNFINQVIIFGMVLAGLFTLFFKFSTLSPLKTLVSYLKELKDNPSKVILPVNRSFCFYEFEELKNSLASYNRQLIEAQTEIEAQRLAAYEQSRMDSLSNILNRRAFDERLDHLLYHFHKRPRPIGFMLLDCDFFKAINDTYGHEVGDAVIRTTAATFQASLPKGVLIYRIGGDEFACITDGLSMDDILNLSQICYQAIRNYDFKHLGIRERISFSIGISYVDENNPEDISLMHKQADIALYKAKRSLHQKVQIYQKQDEHAGKTLTSNEHITAIVDSLHTGQNIQMHLQPVFNAQNQVVYFESLIRIQYQARLIYPSEIFDVVNHRHLETELDKQVINNILEMLNTNLIPEATGVSINISASTLLNEDLNVLFAPLRPYLTSFKIAIEIVEDTLISNIDIATQKLQTLRGHGFLIALDDFGSGYSSIRYLAHMPVDIIKFDMSLTHALMSDDKTRKIIETTAQMILDAGYQLVLEGVETEQHLQAARLIGATHYQGYLLGRPAAPRLNQQ